MREFDWGECGGSTIQAGFHSRDAFSWPRFIRKVYGIIAAMLAFTFATTFLFVYDLR